MKYTQIPDQSSAFSSLFWAASACALRVSASRACLARASDAKSSGLMPCSSCASSDAPACRYKYQFCSTGRLVTGQPARACHPRLKHLYLMRPPAPAPVSHQRAPTPPPHAAASRSDLSAHREKRPPLPRHRWPLRAPSRRTHARVSPPGRFAPRETPPPSPARESPPRAPRRRPRAEGSTPAPHAPQATLPPWPVHQLPSRGLVPRPRAAPCPYAGPSRRATHPPAR
eukprot:scaffold36118_cov61-Phaeocystis_antarctica.AAC.8